MDRNQKAERVAALNKRFATAKLAVLTDFTGMPVAEVTDLRAKLKAAKGEYHVVKNTLGRRAAKDTALAKLAEQLQGPNGLVLAQEEVVATAKALTEFLKTSKKLNIKGGLLEGAPITADDLKSIAALPSREVLLGQVLGVFQAVPTSFVSVLAAVPRGLLNVLKALEEKKAKAA